MKYELIVERTQPPCGGKPTKLYDFHSIETDDPMSYVRKHEPNFTPDIEADMENDGSGTITVTFMKGAQHVKYEFTED